jgi:hypothetical protein
MIFEAKIYGQLWRTAGRDTLRSGACRDPAAFARPVPPPGGSWTTTVTPAASAAVRVIGAVLVAAATGHPPGPDCQVSRTPGFHPHGAMSGPLLTTERAAPVVRIEHGRVNRWYCQLYIFSPALLQTWDRR